MFLKAMQKKQMNNQLNAYKKIYEDIDKNPEQAKIDLKKIIDITEKAISML